MSTKKRLLFVVTKSNFGGAQRYVYELALAMREAGYTVAVAAGGNGELVTRLAAAGITVFPIAGAQRDISVVKEWTAFRSLHHILHTFRPDIVHLNSSKVGVLGSVAARLTHVPRVIFTAHGWPFLEERPRWWRALAWLGSYLTALLSHQIITVSQHDKANQHMPGITKKTAVLHPALYPFKPLSRDAARAALFSPAEQSRHRSHVWLVTIGELTANKNHSTLIDVVAAFNTTQHTQLFLTIIGDGELKTALHEQIELRGMTDKITLYGHLPDARNYLTAFDIFLLPSRKEGLPYALLEAGYAELPCIASHVGGIPEVITDGVNGFLINPHSPREIEESLETLINEPNVRISFANNLATVVRQHFSPIASIESLKRIYESH